MSIIAIVAVSKNLAIGRNGNLPWSYPADLKFFKKTTSGNTVVMGYNTWLSIGRPLPNRKNIVLSRARTMEGFPEVEIMRSPSEVIAYARTADSDTFILGGAETYNLFARHIDRWIVTEIPESVPDADAFMPEDYLSDFILTGTEQLEGGLTVSFYDRKN